MRNLFAVVTITLGSLGLASVQASPVVPSGVNSAVEQLGGVEAVHCTPKKRHHIPTWNYQADGCRRPSKKKATAKAKAKDPVKAKAKDPAKAPAKAPAKSKDAPPAK